MKSKKFEVNADKVLFTPLEEDGVLYVMEENKYLSLNTTYTAIVQKIVNGLDFNGIVAQLMTEFEVEQNDCETQVTKVIEDLLAKGYLNDVTA